LLARPQGQRAIAGGPNLLRRLEVSCRSPVPDEDEEIVEKTSLSEREKASLVALARRLADQAARSGQVDPTNGDLPAGDFSTEGVLARVMALEQRLADASRTWSGNLNTVLFAVERLERTCNALQGHYDAVRDSVQEVDRKAAEHQIEAKAAAIEFADRTAAEMKAVLDRVNSLVSDVVAIYGPGSSRRA
jgi:MoxR-like ATPase